MAPNTNTVRSMQVLHFAALRQPTARLTTMAVYYNDNGDRSPLIEDVLQGHPDIPIQHTVVHLQSLDHGQVYTFCLSYRFNRLFLRNRALYALEPDMKWTGDMVVTKMGILNDYVNINAGRDRRVAVRAVYNFLSRVKDDIEIAGLLEEDVVFPAEIHCIDL